MSIEHVEKVYDRTARIYDHLFGPFFEAAREVVPELLELYPGARLLEVGVGTGLSLPYIPSDVQVTGIDLSEGMLEKARQRVQDLELSNITLHKMDASKMDFPDDSFDCVLAAYFISTVPEPVKVIQEIKRVCKPGGYLLFLNHFRYERFPLSVLAKMAPLFYRIGFRTDLAPDELMESADLEIETLEQIGAFGHWKAVRCINP